MQRQLKWEGHDARQQIRPVADFALQVLTESPSGRTLAVKAANAAMPCNGGRFLQPNRRLSATQRCAKLQVGLAPPGTDRKAQPSHELGSAREA